MYIFDEKLIGKVVECIQPTAAEIVHPTDGEKAFHKLICPSGIIIVINDII
jgi:hypothetical protein